MPAELINILKIALPVFLTAFLAILGTRKHAERQRFIEEAAKFKEAFAPAITQFETTVGRDRDILYNEFDAQELAYNRFANFIPKGKLSRFSDAWKKYKHHAQERNSGDIIQFLGREALDPDKMDDEQHLNEVADMRNKQALEHIHALLKFTK